MCPINRRTFFSYAASALAGTSILTEASSVSSEVYPQATRLVTLGNTGLTCSYLGIGTGVRGRGSGITDLTMNLTGEQFVSLLEYAYSRGITYFDLADRYGSHHYMRVALQRSIPRDKVMILSKVWSRTPQAVSADLDRMREELDTDVIDVVLIHCIREGEDNWPETLRPVMDVLSDAKAKGHIRAHGVSCHNLVAFERVPEEPWCDVVLARINPFGLSMDGPPEKIVPVLEKAYKMGKGVLGMKILGEGAPEVINQMDTALRFACNLTCMHAMTIGFVNEQQLNEVMQKLNVFQV